MPDIKHIKVNNVTYDIPTGGGGLEVVECTRNSSLNSFVTTSKLANNTTYMIKLNVGNFSPTITDGNNNTYTLRIRDGKISDTNTLTGWDLSLAFFIAKINGSYCDVLDLNYNYLMFDIPLTANNVKYLLGNAFTVNHYASDSTNDNLVSSYATLFSTITAYQFSRDLVLLLCKCKDTSLIKTGNLTGTVDASHSSSIFRLAGLGGGYNNIDFNRIHIASMTSTNPLTYSFYGEYMSSSNPNLFIVLERCKGNF